MGLGLLIFRAAGAFDAGNFNRDEQDGQDFKVPQALVACGAASGG